MNQTKGPSVGHPFGQSWNQGQSSKFQGFGQSAKISSTFLGQGSEGVGCWVLGYGGGFWLG